MFVLLKRSKKKNNKIQKPWKLLFNKKQCMILRLIIWQLQQLLDFYKQRTSGWFFATFFLCFLVLVFYFLSCQLFLPFFFLSFFCVFKCSQNYVKEKLALRLTWVRELQEKAVSWKWLVYGGLDNHSTGGWLWKQCRLDLFLLFLCSFCSSFSFLKAVIFLKNH